MRTSITDHKTLDQAEHNSGGGFSGNIVSAKNLRRLSHTDSTAGQQQSLHLKTKPNGGLRRPVSSDSLQSLDSVSPTGNQYPTSDFSQQAMGGLAACLLAGSCVQDMVSDPELGMLLVSGHADVLSAKVCSLNRELEGDRGFFEAMEAPKLSKGSQELSSDNFDVVDSSNNHLADGTSEISKSSTETSSRPEKKPRVSPRASQSDEATADNIMDFLRSKTSPMADEASCLAASSVDEAPRTRTNPVTRYIRTHQGAISGEISASEVLQGSLEEEEEILFVRGGQSLSRRAANRGTSPSTL